MQYLKIPTVQIYLYPTHTDDSNHEIGMSILRTYFPIMDSFRQMQNMDLGNINLYVSTFLKPQTITEAKTQKPFWKFKINYVYSIATSYYDTFY